MTEYAGTICPASFPQPSCVSLEPQKIRFEPREGSLRTTTLARTKELQAPSCALNRHTSEELQKTSPSEHRLQRRCERCTPLAKNVQSTLPCTLRLHPGRELQPVVSFSFSQLVADLTKGHGRPPGTQGCGAYANSWNWCGVAPKSPQCLKVSSACRSVCTRTRSVLLKECFRFEFHCEIVLTNVKSA